MSTRKQQAEERLEKKLLARREQRERIMKFIKQFFISIFNIIGYLTLPLWGGIVIVFLLTWELIQDGRESKMYEMLSGKTILFFN